MLLVPFLVPTIAPLSAGVALRRLLDGSALLRCRLRLLPHAAVHWTISGAFDRTLRRRRVLRHLHGRRALLLRSRLWLLWLLCLLREPSATFLGRGLRRIL